MYYKLMMSLSKNGSVGVGPWNVNGAGSASYSSLWTESLRLGQKLSGWGAKSSKLQSSKWYVETKLEKYFWIYLEIIFNHVTRKTISKIIRTFLISNFVTTYFELSYFELPPTCNNDEAFLKLCLTARRSHAFLLYCLGICSNMWPHVLTGMPD